MTQRKSEVLSVEIDAETGEPLLRFGDWLVRRGLIDRGQRDEALRAATACSCRVGDALVYMAVLERGCVEQEATVHDTFTAFHRPSHLAAVLLQES